MSKMPWVRFFPSDWLGGTRGMSAVETGVYITLIATMYERCEPVVEDHARLSRLCGASNSAFKKALESLIDEGKILRTEAGLWNDRVEKEQVYLSEKSEVGSKAARVRWDQKNNKNNATSDANALPAESQGNANQKPDTRIDTPAKAVASTRTLDLEPSALEQKLRDAAGEKIHPHAAFIVGPILELISAGCDLELDVIPTIRSKAAQLSQPARSWGYFTQAIRDSTDRRIAAGKLTSSPNARPPPQRMTAHQQRHQSAIDAFNRKLGIPTDDEFTGNTIDLGNADFQPH